MKTNTYYGLSQKLRQDSKDVLEQNVYHINFYVCPLKSAKSVNKHIFFKWDDPINKSPVTTFLHQYVTLS